MKNSMAQKRRQSGRIANVHAQENGGDAPEHRERHKRRRSIAPEMGRPQEFASREDDAGSETSSAQQSPPKKVRKILSHVTVPGPAYPRSAYQGWRMPLPPVSESKALTDLKTGWDTEHARSDEQSEYIYFTLEDFSVYRPEHHRHGHELCTLDRLQNRNGFNEFLFDGILTCSNKRKYVQGVRFRTMAIDGYGDPDICDPHRHICIQSSEAKRREIWYQLGKPSKVYKRFWDPFLWLAQFTKYFVDYLLETKDTTLRHFRSDFFSWLHSRYHDYKSYKLWLTACCLRDFCTTVAANVGFLWKECCAIDDAKIRICEYPLWGEVDPFRLTTIPKRDNQETRTIVTPFVYECFKHMYFAEHLEKRDVTDLSLRRKIEEEKRRRKLTAFGAFEADMSMPTPTSMSDSPTMNTQEFREGDVVRVEVDDKSHWQTSSLFWYAYVQTARKVDDSSESRIVLDVLWLYEPQDTTLGKAYYPFKNELFLSDNCACDKEAIPATCVVDKVDVAWFEDPRSCSGLFVRQKFRTVHDEDSYDFVSLQKNDFKCSCYQRVSAFERCRRDYQIGDNVLAREYNTSLGDDVLEPAQVVDFDLDMQQVVLRRLKRKTQVDPKARLNELLLTEELFRKAPSRIIRKCDIRFYSQAELQRGLPTPYNRDGAGAYFFIIRKGDAKAERDDDDDDDHDLSEPDENDSRPYMPPLEQGWDPKALLPSGKLKGMGLFCGGGNFDRGLEDGGAVEFRWAIDWDERALHSYRANTREPGNVQFYLGSVNDYLAQAIGGSQAVYIAQPGGVQIIAGGSPCPGFSNMQLFKDSEASLRNASMVASIVSFLDFYCVEYFILENVVEMTKGLGPASDENVFAQILAAIVAMGYQVQQFLADSWSLGSPQSRPRLFIVASAPGLNLLPPPPYTHAHPPGVEKQQRSLGKSSNGLPFGMRRNEYTPFQHVSPSKATADLPNIAESQVQLCPAFPDHRTPSDPDGKRRALIAAVPQHPHGMDIGQAGRKGLLSGATLKYYDGLNQTRRRENSKTLSRVHPNRLFPTVLTTQRVACGRHGRTLHWEQNRPLSVMELKRAQGYLDDEVVVGNPFQQVTIIGNSVDRKVGLALGLSLRGSWLNSTFAGPLPG